MKTFKEVKDNITTAFCSNSYMKEYYHLDDNKTFDEQFSVVSFESILFDVMAGIMFILQELFNRHKLETNEALDKLKPHNLKWYHNKILGFQYGFDLLPDSDKFDNTGKTDEQIANSKIIKYCAITEVNEPSRLVMKVATEQEDKLTRLSDEQQVAFGQYVSEIKDAGVGVTLISYLPDKLKLGIRIIRDKLVLNKEGQHIVNKNYPVNDALKEFVKSLPFNGELSIQKLIDTLQRVEGVVDLSIDSAEISSIEDSGYGDYKNIDISVTPESGYFELNLTENNINKTDIEYL